LINWRKSPKVHLDGKKESVSSAKSLGFPDITKLPNSGIKCISYPYKMITLVMKIILTKSVLKRQL
jgi:hypothetical protein